MMEKSPLNVEVGSPEKKFLGTKRIHSTLSENFIFRKALTNVSTGNYEKTSSIYRNIFSFNWEDEKILKMKYSPLAYMSPSAFWFYISSQYFPFSSNEFFNNTEELRKMLDILLETFSHSKSLKKISQNFNKKHFLYDLVSLVYPECVREEIKNIKVKEDRADDKTAQVAPAISSLTQTAGREGEIENINKEKEKENVDETVLSYKVEMTNQKKTVSVDKMISDIESVLKSVQSQNEDNFDEMCYKIAENKDFLCTDSPEKEHTIDYDDVLTDMQFYSDLIGKYHEYIVDRHNQNIKRKENAEVLTKFEDEQNKTVPDDVVCAVCNSGDYEDNDLIVFCSTCNIAVHQNCYGILKIPKDDWICESCLCFGLEGSKKLECILCPVKGGALKITTLKKKSTFVKFVHSLGKKNKALFEVNRKDLKENTPGALWNSSNNNTFCSNNGNCIQSSLPNLAGDVNIISTEENLINGISSGENGNGCLNKSISNEENEYV